MSEKGKGYMQEVKLSTGFVEFMGSGVVAVRQVDETGVVQTVVLTVEDLERMLAAR